MLFAKRASCLSRGHCALRSRYLAGDSLFANCSFDNLSGTSRTLTSVHWPVRSWQIPSLWGHDLSVLSPPGFAPHIANGSFSAVSPLTGCAFVWVFSCLAFSEEPMRLWIFFCVCVYVCTRVRARALLFSWGVLCGGRGTNLGGFGALRWPRRT